MRRTKLPFPNYVNLIRKMTWSFHYTSGINWEELFCEACLAYCEAIRTYDRRKSMFSTWVVHCVTYALTGFCNNENKHTQMTFPIEENFMEIVNNPSYEFFDEPHKIPGGLSDDTREIVLMLLDNPDRYSFLKSKAALGRIKEDLREKKKWIWPRIENAMRSARKELADV